MRQTAILGFRGVLCSVGGLLAAACGGAATGDATVPPASLAQGSRTEAADGAWMADLHRRAEADAYGVFVQVGARIVARNSAQGLKISWSSAGVEMDRTGGGEGLRIGLASVEGAGAAPRLGACRADGARGSDGECLRRVEIEHGGGLLEWWENREEGLEQGFEVDDEGAGLDGELRIEIDVDRALVEIAASGSEALLHGGDGFLIRYAGLRAWDAGGDPLAAAIEPRPRGLSLVVDASGARYPVTIDPLLTSIGWAYAGGEAGEQLGWSVAGVGDCNGDGFGDVLVGSPGYDAGPDDTGRALLFLGSASGLATSPAWSTAGTQEGERAGRTVAGAGDVDGDGLSDLLVASPYWDNGESNEGAVALYLGSSSGPSLAPDWWVEGGLAEALFGVGLAAAGDLNNDGYSDVAVGSPYASTFLIQAGRAQVWLGSATGLPSTPSWTVDSGTAYGLYGATVARAGDVNRDGFSDLAVTAPLASNGQNYEGSAFVYHGSATGPSTVAAWVGEPDQGSASYGSSARGAGDVNGDGYGDLIVGAQDWDSDEVNAGGAWLYLGGSSGLSGNAAWVFEGTQDHGRLGGSVSDAGDVNGDGFADVVIGEPEWADGPDVGRAHLFFGSSSGLSEDPDWAYQESGGAYTFGYSVSSAGDVDGDGFADVVIGAPNWAGGAGRAYLFHGAPAGVADEAARTLDSGQAGSLFGGAVAWAGDVNGDGFDDVAVGANGYDNGQANEGRVWLYLGSASGIASTPSWFSEGGLDEAYWGFRIGSAGDVDADGYSDLLVSTYANGPALAGRAALYRGSVSGLHSTPQWDVFGSSGEWFGYSSCGAGDVDADGYDDVLVAAYAASNGEVEEGAIHYFRGSASGLESSAAWTVEGEQANANIGAAVAGIGDVNGDAFADILYTAPTYDYLMANDGRAWLHFGGPAGPSATADWVWSAPANVGFGVAASGAGDVNGDGYADFAVGATYWSDPEPSEGRVLVFHGAAGGPATDPAWELSPDVESSSLGDAISSAGDVDGDGYGDLLLGAYRWGAGEDDPGANGGGAWLYLGSASGLLPGAAWATEGDPGDWLGAAVAGGGDGDGDGYSDLLVGSAEYPTQGPGLLQVFRGNSADGTGTAFPPRPRQRRASSTVPVAPGLRSPSQNDFDVALLARSPFGRGDARLETQVEIAANPFGTSASSYSAWVDTGTLGATVTHGISGLPAESGLHWRSRLRYGPADATAQLWGRWVYGGAPGAPLSDHLFTGCSSDVDGDGLCPGWDPDDDDDGSLDADDCDDSDPTIHPGAPESCDAVDSDCDGDLVDGFDDFDGDGDPDCTDPDDDDDGEPDTTDCAPLDPSIHPGAAEICDGIDQDCDGLLDDGFPDFDADGVADCVDPDDDGDGSLDADDCAPLDPTIYPGAPESCDSVDSDCDGDLVDGAADLDEDGSPDCVDPDDDGDGSLDGDDCAPLDPSIRPGAEEILDDGIDQDCSGADTVSCYVDADGDGVGVPPVVPDPDGDCTDAGQSAAAGDCDDDDASNFPGNTETCDGGDNDCDAASNELVDGDGDGLSVCQGDCDDGDASRAPSLAEVCDGGIDNDCDPESSEDEDRDGDGRSICGGDCDDEDPSVGEGADELCDGVDNDCDGELPEDEADADGDGVRECGGDCNDGDPDVAEAGTEADAAACSNGRDDDCDGLVDAADGDCEEPLFLGPGCLAECQGSLAGRGRGAGATGIAVAGGLALLLRRRRRRRGFPRRAAGALFLSFLAAALLPPASSLAAESEASGAAALVLVPDASQGAGRAERRIPSGMASRVVELPATQQFSGRWFLGTTPSGFCNTPSTSLDQFRAAVGKARAQAEMLDTAGGRAALSGLRQAIGCLNAVPDPEDLWTLHFVEAVAAFIEEGVGPAIPSLERALGIRPGREYDSSYPPELGAAYLEAQRKALGMRAARAYSALPADPPQLWIDGVAVAAGGLPVTPGEHLLQVKGSDGIVRGGVLTLAPDDVVVVGDPQTVATALIALDAADRRRLGERLARDAGMPAATGVPVLLVDAGGAVAELGAPMPSGRGSKKPDSAVVLGLGGGYQWSGNWHYASVAADLGLGLVGPLALEIQARPAIGRRSEPRDDGTSYVPILLSLGAGPVLRFGNPVRARLGAVFQASLDADEGGGSARRFIAGAAGIASLEIPLLPKRVYLRPGFEGGFLGRYAVLRGGVQIALAM